MTRRDPLTMNFHSDAACYRVAWAKMTDEQVLEARRKRTIRADRTKRSKDAKVTLASVKFLEPKP